MTESQTDGNLLALLHRMTSIGVKRCHKMIPKLARAKRAER